MGLSKIGKKLIRAGLIGSLLLGCSDSGKVSGPSSQPPPPPPPPAQNLPPTFNSSPVIGVDENRNYEYQVQARDPEGASLNYSISGAPWLSISPSGLITGTAPEVQSDQTSPIEVRVSDGINSPAQNYNLTVRNLFNIHSLSQTQTAGLAVTDTSLSFSQPMNFVAGDVISSGITAVTPYGLFREVASVSSDRRTVATRNASLENVVRDASLAYNQQLSPSSIAGFNALPGISMSQRSVQDLNFNIGLTNVVLYDRDGDPATTDDRIILNGNISFNAGFNFDLDIRGFALNSLTFEQTLNDVSDITIGSNLFGFATQQEVKLAEYRFTPVVIGVLPTLPPIPIIIAPKIVVSAGLNASRANPLGFRVRQDANLTARLIYNGAWNPSVDFTNSFDFFLPPPLGEWDITAYAGPRLSIPLFGVAGPFAAASAFLKLQSPSNGDWKLYGGFNASLGASVEILSRRITAYSRSVLEHQILLAERGTTSEQRIAYVTDPGNSTSVIATTNPDGTGRQTLTTTSSLANYPVWSPDRREIAYSKWIESGRMDIFVLGNNPRQLTSTGVNAPGSWSPDGTKMVISSFRNNNNDIYIINSSDGSGITRLTTHSAEDIHPVWSSDNWIYFISRRDGNREVYRIRPDASSLTRLTNNNSDEDNPSISPDGTNLLVNSNYDGDNEIYMINLTNGNAAQFTNNSVQDYQPSFSPDGTRIVFVSERSGRGAQLYIMNVDGSSQTKITDEYLDNRPRWN